MSEHEHMSDLVPLYALGALEGRELDEFEQHLKSGCESCHAALLEHEAVAADLALVLPAGKPSARTREQLFERVRADAPGPAAVTPLRKSPMRAALPLALAASLLVIVALGARLVSERQTIARLQAANAATSNELARAQAERNAAAEQLARAEADLQGRLASAQAALDALTSPDTRPVSLAGKGNAASASATAFLAAKQGRLLLYVHGLPPTAPGRTYQLWVIIEGKPVSLGIFDVEPSGQAHMTAQKLPELRGPVTIAVTEEPAGGVPQPTGPMVLAGS